MDDPGFWWEFVGKVGAPVFAATLDGFIEDPLGARGLDLRVRLEVPDVEALDDVMPAYSWPAGRISIASDVSGSIDDLRLGDLIIDYSDTEGRSVKISGAIADALELREASLDLTARLPQVQVLLNRFLETDIPALDDDGIHPLNLALDVQAAMNDGDWLVIDGGNTHFWSEIAVNIAGQRGLALGNVLHPGTFSMLGVGVPFASVAKLNHPAGNVVVISGDGAFLSAGSSIEAAFQENLPIVVVIDNNGGLDCISQQQERLFSNQQHFATDFRDIPFHSMFEGLGGYGELVQKRADIVPAVRRALASGKTACVNVKTVGHISPIVLATTSKRDKASIE